MTSDYPAPRSGKRSPQEWEEWWAEFRKRNGLDKTLPNPPADAPALPKHHSDTEPEEP